MGGEKDGNWGKCKKKRSARENQTTGGRSLSNTEEAKNHTSHAVWGEKDLNARGLNKDKRKNRDERNGVVCGVTRNTRVMVYNQWGGGDTRGLPKEMRKKPASARLLGRKTFMKTT